MWQALKPFLAVLSGLVVAVLLAGCGDDKPKPTPSGGSTTTPGPDTPAGPIECPADFKRGHCTKCYYSGGSGGETSCQDCSSPYKLTDKKCVVSCSDMPTPPEKPGMPDNAQSYNGMTWPSTCFDEEEIHFFTVGDWGGVCDWGTGKCSDGSNPYAGQYPELKGKPFPMPNRRGAPLSEPVACPELAYTLVRLKVEPEIWPAFLAQWNYGDEGKDHCRDFIHQALCQLNCNGNSGQERWRNPTRVAAAHIREKWEIMRRQREVNQYGKRGQYY